MSGPEPRFGLPPAELKARLRRAEAAFAGAPDFQAAMPVLASVLRDIEQTRLEDLESAPVKDLERSARALVAELERTRGTQVAEWLGDAARARPELGALIEGMERARAELEAPSAYAAPDPKAHPWIRLDPRPELERLLHASPWLFDPDWSRALELLEQGERAAEGWSRRVARRRGLVRGAALAAAVAGSALVLLVLPVPVWARVVGVASLALVTLLARPHAPLREDSTLRMALAGWAALLLGAALLGSRLGGRTEGTVSFAKGCRIRAEPTVDSEVLGSLGPGQTAAVLEERGRWRRVEIAGAAGWVGCRD